MRSPLCTLFLFITVALASTSASAQVCEGRIELITQDEVDAFDCTEVTGALYINRPCFYSATSSSITNLDGLAELTTIGGRLEICHNTALLNIEGLSSLTSIGGKLTIGSNDALISTRGLEGLTFISGELGIGYNDALTSLEGLANIQYVTNRISISHNESLTNLDGLSGLTRADGALWISNNPALLSVDGLENLSTVGRLFIRRNGSLANVDGLSGLNTIYGLFRLEINYSLSDCTVGLRELLEGGGVRNGNVFIQDNAPGCNSVWEAMGFGIDAEDEATPLMTDLAAPYPNPTIGAATLTYSLAEPGDVTLTLYDALGRRVRTLAEGPQAAGEHEVTLGADLPAGTYVVRFATDGQAWTERVAVIR